MADKNSLEQWGVVRSHWVASPLSSFADLAVFLGISKQAIAKRVKRNAWQRSVDMARIAGLAHQQADHQSAA